MKRNYKKFTIKSASEYSDYYSFGYENPSFVPIVEFQLILFCLHLLFFNPMIVGS